MPSLLIVSHGQPSDPAPAEAALADLARAVAAHLPGWRVTSATLAAPGALAAAVAAAGPGAVVHPLFMADGWFTARHLPDRLAQAGAQGARLTAPLGLLPGLADLALDRVRAAAAAQGWAAGETTVLVAAHGSFRSGAPARVARDLAAHLVAGGLGAAQAAFIDQDPQIAAAAADLPARSLCLAFFAAGGGHVTDDLPRALAAAGFAGPVLPPIGGDAQVPALIAAAARDQADRTLAAG